MSSSKLPKWRRAAFATLTLVPLLGCFACGSDEALVGDEPGPGSDPEGFPVLTAAHEPTCAGFNERLRTCGVLTDGPFACEEPGDERASCTLECLTSASCLLLWDYQCRSLPRVIERCQSKCNSFVCDSGEAIPFEWQCDAEVDCLLDGSDEVGCETFECGSGEVLPVRYRCNWVTNCLDNSDEAGCDGFECASGGSIPPYWECDLDLDCPDGSDEVDCPSLVCASTGEELPAAWRCDQLHDCLDGSDERGCAELLCR